MSKVIVLNQDFSYISSVSTKKAIKLVVTGKAEILKAGKELVRAAGKVICNSPMIIRLTKLVRLLYKRNVPYTKKNVLIRDNHTCMYCGSTDHLTIDHVIPRMYNGKSTWENTVTACKSCNSRKGSKMPSEVKMFVPSNVLVQPTVNEFMQKRMEQLGIDKILKDLFNELSYS